MRFIQETGFSVRPGREEAFQQWLVANEARLAGSYPSGTEYVGMYAAMYTSEKNAGAYRLLEQLDSYAALDTLAALQKDPASELAKVWREASPFFDPDPHADWSRTLLKAVTDATIWDLPQEE